MKRPNIDLDELLTGKPSWADIVSFWQHGTFHEERYLVTAIKKYLLTPQQKKILAGLDLRIEDCLNGRYDDRQASKVETIYREWNTKLGFRVFLA